MYKKISVSVLLAVLVAFTTFSMAFADGETFAVSVTEELEKDISAKSAILIDSDTKRVIFFKDGDKKMHVSHLTKLMTLLIVAENIEKNNLTLETKCIASSKANSMGDPQIWLNAGEEISVSELIKAIIVGNANDAAVVLAEKICTTEEKFVEKMNDKAVEMGLNDTYFGDCTGLSKEQNSSAQDLAILATKLLEYDFLKPYFTIWMDNVRDGKTEVVSQNRMLKTYSGITGMKACSGAESGQCLVSTASKSGLSLVCVLLDCESSESKFKDAKLLLDYGFSEYFIFSPEIPDDVLSEIPVKNGEENFCKIKIEIPKGIAVQKGDVDKVEVKIGKEKIIEAPIKMNEKVGEIQYYLNDEKIFSVNILSNSNINKITFLYAFKKILTNLLKM